MSPRYDALPTELSVLSSDTLTSSYPGRLPRNILPPSHSYARLEATTSDSRSSLDSQDSYADEKEAVESELRLGGQSPGYRSRSNQARRFLRQRPYLAPFVALFAVILALALFLGAHSRLAARNRFSGHGRTPISMEHAFNGSLSYSFSGLHWIKSAGDGVYAAKNHQSGSIQLTDLTNNSTRQLVDGADLKDASGHRLVYTDYSVSPDMRYMLLATQVRSQWRHSFFAQYYVHHFDSKQTLLLVPQAKEADVAIASWAPQGHAIAFVRGNNVFIKQDPRQDDVIQVTDNGSDTFFNGIADWVYEEEVFGSSKAIWWSPDAQKLAFASFDESEVPNYTFPVYSHDPWFPGKETPYPDNTTMRYPKPGYSNPEASLRIFDLETYSSHSSLPPNNPENDAQEARSAVIPLHFKEPLQEPILVDVAWIGASDILVKRSDRFSVILEESHFDLTDREEDRTVTGRTVRQTNFKAVDDGWYEPTQSITPFRGPTVLDDDSLPSGYLDIIPNRDGFRHIAYFKSPADSRSTFLTSGPWEVNGKILSLDVTDRRIWFYAAAPSTQNKLMWIPFPDSDKTSSDPIGAPTDAFPEITYAQAAFSPFGRFMQIASLGEPVPWQKLVSTNNTDNVYLEDANELLRATHRLLRMPKHSVKELPLNETGSIANVHEILPPDFDDSGRTKYPVLFRVYGGPGSTLANEAFQREAWHDVLASTHHYVVVNVDGRGTGLRGRQYRVGVHGELGTLEAEDQRAVARHYASLRWVDPNRLGIWGWSYGGYLTSKVIETSGGLYSLGMAVAPVTDWRFYDSIYSERYMGDSFKYSQSYEKSAITDMRAFHNTSFFLAAGSGDDNVHYLNSATLLDRLTVAQVRNFYFRMFTDSSHSMMTRGARRELYEDMTRFLVDQWGPTKLLSHAGD